MAARNGSADGGSHGRGLNAEQHRRRSNSPAGPGHEQHRLTWYMARGRSHPARGTARSAIDLRQLPPLHLREDDPNAVAPVPGQEFVEIAARLDHDGPLLTEREVAFV